MPIINFPPTFDLNYYRKSYPELRNFPDEILMEHYKKFAIEHGLSTCAYDQREPIQKILQNAINHYHLKTLEISPWDNPFIKGESVKYFDTMDAETLKNQALGASRSFNDVPNKIDFVSPNGDLSVINEKFDVAFSSHVIEHCPNLVEHFQNVSKILNKGGLYILIVPDKRYCFDHYHSESTITEVLDAFFAKRKFPRLADVINSAYTVTHNDPVRHWMGEHGERYGYRTTFLEPDLKVEIMDEYFFDDGQEISQEKLLKLVEKYVKALKKGEYISTHNWRLTPDSFGYIVNLLNKLGFIDLTIYRLCHTVWGRLEFIAMLEKA